MLMWWFGGAGPNTTARRQLMFDGRQVVVAVRELSSLSRQTAGDMGRVKASRVRATVQYEAGRTERLTTGDRIRFYISGSPCTITDENHKLATRDS